MTLHSQLTSPAPALASRQIALAETVARHAPDDGIQPTSLRGVTLIRIASESKPLPSVYEPSLCIVVQGRKRAVVGDEVYVYDALNYLVVSMTLPARSHIVDAVPGRPYLCLRISIDAQLISELLLQLGPTAVSRPTSGRALFLGRMSEELLDATLRLTALLDRPHEADVIGPLVLKEIHYRVLTGELGYRLRDLCTADSQTQRISHVIRLLKSKYAQPLCVEELAVAGHMSVSSLHHRFKELTALSPMQYLKQLRLHEARRLMLSEGLDASTACYRVGYESPSQFSREYRRLFGVSPRREINTLRAARDSAASIAVGS